ncbi:helix-turn-helix domain-containing protein [Fibrivirga algicola]|uniref:Helix-turn-helix domain-containing protein n=1 Tax=Fibrivirga algicola TaxID=2950420 RepID=A0ABX0QID9_9BACT|nr:helix-turn-helix domain-containing protein [Fibrivirga algicola]NID10633.1 helix-turn-helix domain-containing protein [Fibrivirga algicola]
MYSTTTQIHLTPDQLTELVRIAVRSELADYTPPSLAVELPDYLSRKQAAQTLQVPLTTLNEWAKDTADRSAVLVPQKVGSRVRYKREDVLNAIKESRRFKRS